MSIDGDTEVDTTSASNAQTDTADTAADQASQDSSAQQADDSSSTAPHADPQANEDGSSTSPDTTLQTADQSDGKGSQIDWQAEKAKYEKRIADLRAGHGRVANELHQYRQRYKDIDPDAARKALEARKADIPPWRPNSPDNRSFTATKAAWDRYKQAINSAKTPEARQILVDTYGATFNEKEVQQIQAWEAHQREDAERRAADPEYDRQRLREEMRDELRQELQAQREEQAVEQWFNDTNNKALVERYRDEMIGLMESGWHWQQVQMYIETKAKADGLQSRVGNAEQKSAAARAQQAALKSNAKSSRDSALAPVGKLDFAKMGADYAKKNGLPLNHERVLAHVEKAVANWRASQPNTQ